MLEKGKKKKKLSVDFDFKIYNRMLQYTNNNGISNGGLINFFIENLLELDQDSKRMFSKAIINYVHELDLKISSAAEVEGVFISNQKKALLNLLDFFSDGKGMPEEKKPVQSNAMARIDIKNGYAIFPKDWVILNNMDPKKASNVGVVEVRHGSKYNIPHFVFFLDKPLEMMNDQDYNLINQECIEAFPKFEEIINHQVQPEYDDNHQLLNRELWLSAPKIGYFPILDFEGEDAGYYPCGAMVYRYEK